MAAAACVDPQLAAWSVSSGISMSLSPQSSDHRLSTLADLYPRTAQALEAKLRRAGSSSTLISGAGSSSTLASSQLAAQPRLEGLRSNSRPSSKIGAGQRARWDLQPLLQFLDLSSNTASSSSASLPQSSCAGGASMTSAHPAIKMEDLGRGLHDRPQHGSKLVRRSVPIRNTTAQVRRVASDPGLRGPERSSAKEQTGHSFNSNEYARAVTSHSNLESPVFGNSSMFPDSHVHGQHACASNEALRLEQPPIGGQTLDSFIANAVVAETCQPNSFYNSQVSSPTTPSPATIGKLTSARLARWVDRGSSGEHPSVSPSATFVANEARLSCDHDALDVRLFPDVSLPNSWRMTAAAEGTHASGDRGLQQNTEVHLVDNGLALEVPVLESHRVAPREKLLNGGLLQEHGGKASINGTMSDSHDASSLAKDTPEWPALGSPIRQRPAEGDLSESGPHCPVTPAFGTFPAFESPPAEGSSQSATWRWMDATPAFGGSTDGAGVHLNDGGAAAADAAAGCGRGDDPRCTKGQPHIRFSPETNRGAKLPADQLSCQTSHPATCDHNRTDAGTHFSVEVARWSAAGETANYSGLHIPNAQRDSTGGSSTPAAMSIHRIGGHNPPDRSDCAQVSFEECETATHQGASTMTNISTGSEVSPKLDPRYAGLLCTPNANGEGNLSTCAGRPLRSSEARSEGLTSGESPMRVWEQSMVETVGTRPAKNAVTVPSGCSPNFGFAVNGHTHVSFEECSAVHPEAGAGCLTSLESPMRVWEQNTVRTGPLVNAVTGPSRGPLMDTCSAEELAGGGLPTQFRVTGRIAEARSYVSQTRMRGEQSLGDFHQTSKETLHCFERSDIEAGGDAIHDVMEGDNSSCSSLPSPIRDRDGHSLQTAPVDRASTCGTTDRDECNPGRDAICESLFIGLQTDYSGHIGSNVDDVDGNVAPKCFGGEVMGEWTANGNLRTSVRERSGLSGSEVGIGTQFGDWIGPDGREVNGGALVGEPSGLSGRELRSSSYIGGRSGPAGIEVGDGTPIGEWRGPSHREANSSAPIQEWRGPAGRKVSSASLLGHLSGPAGREDIIDAPTGEWSGPTSREDSSGIHMGQWNGPSGREVSIGEWSQPIGRELSNGTPHVQWNGLVRIEGSTVTPIGERSGPSGREVSTGTLNGQGSGLLCTEGSTGTPIGERSGPACREVSSGTPSGERSGLAGRAVSGGTPIGERSGPSGREMSTGTPNGQWSGHIRREASIGTSIGERGGPVGREVSSGTPIGERSGVSGREVSSGAPIGEWSMPVVREANSVTPIGDRSGPAGREMSRGTPIGQWYGLSGKQVSSGTLPGDMHAGSSDLAKDEAIRSHHHEELTMLIGDRAGTRSVGVLPGKGLSAGFQSRLSRVNNEQAGEIDGARDIVNEGCEPDLNDIFFPMGHGYSNSTGTSGPSSNDVAGGGQPKRENKRVGRKRILRTGSDSALGLDEGSHGLELDRTFEFAPVVKSRFGFGIRPGRSPGISGAPSNGTAAQATVEASPKSSTPAAKDQSDGKAKGKGKGKPPPPKAKGEPEATGKGKGKGKAGPPPPAAKGKAGGKGKGGAPPPKASPGEAEVKGAQAVRAMPKTKPLSWRKIDAASEGTLWALNRSCMEDFQVEREQIEELFSWAQPGKQLKLPSGGATKEATKEKEQIKLTSKERVMGICIGLRCLKHLGHDGIRQAILDLDSCKLTSEATERLLMCDAKSRQPTVLPSTEELAAARAHVASGLPGDALDEASRFIVAVHDIPHLRDRLLLHQFRLSFDETVESLRNDLASLRIALHQVRESHGFAVILMFVLKAGNILNDGTERGNASGFRMDSLAALTLLKGHKSQAGTSKGAEAPPGGGQALSLVDYMVGVIEQQRPQLLEDVPKELKDVAQASRLELEEIERNAREKRQELQKIARSIGVSLQSEDAPTKGDDEVATKERQSIVNNVDPGLSGASEFLKQTMHTLDSIDQEVGEVKTTYKEVSEFFGEQRKAKADQIPLHEWLGFITRFLVEMQKALAAHRARLERAKRAETAQAQKAMRGARKKTLIYAARQQRERRFSGGSLRDSGNKRESVHPKKEGDRLHQFRIRKTVRQATPKDSPIKPNTPTGKADDPWALTLAEAGKTYAGRSLELMVRRRRRIKRRVSLNIKKLLRDRCRQERARHLVLKYRKFKCTPVYDSDTESEEGNESEADAESKPTTTPEVMPETGRARKSTDGSHLSLPEGAVKRRSTHSSCSAHAPHGRGIWGRLRMSTEAWDTGSRIRSISKNPRKSPSATRARSSEKRSSSKHFPFDDAVHKPTAHSTQKEHMSAVQDSQAYPSENAQAACEEGLGRVPRVSKFRASAKPFSRSFSDSTAGATRDRSLTEVASPVRRGMSIMSISDEAQTEVEKRGAKIEKRLSFATDTTTHIPFEGEKSASTSKDGRDSTRSDSVVSLVPAQRELSRIMAKIGMSSHRRLPKQRKSTRARELHPQHDSADSDEDSRSWGSLQSEPAYAARSKSVGAYPGTKDRRRSAPVVSHNDGQEVLSDPAHMARSASLADQAAVATAVRPEKEQSDSSTVDCFDMAAGRSSDGLPKNQTEPQHEGGLQAHPAGRRSSAFAINGPAVSQRGEVISQETAPIAHPASWQQTRSAPVKRRSDRGATQKRRFTVESGAPDMPDMPRRKKSELGAMLQAVTDLGEELRRGFAAPSASEVEY